MAEAEKAVSELARLVPEAFVDLLRRVIPGVLTIAAFAFVSRPGSLREVNSLSWVSVFVLLLASYSIGLVLDSLTVAATDWLFMGMTWSGLDKSELAGVARFLGRNAGQPPKPYRLLEDRSIPGLLRARIRKCDAEANLIVPKLVAEELLLRNSATGLLFVVLMGALKNWTKSPLFSRLFPEADWNSLVWIGLTAVPMMLASYYRAKRTLRRTIEFYHLHNTPSIDGKEAAAGPERQPKEAGTAAGTP